MEWRFIRMLSFPTSAIPVQCNQISSTISANRFTHRIEKQSSIIIMPVNRKQVNSYGFVIYLIDKSVFHGNPS